ncbi:hypothetical protein BDDG_02515 [Blastomyces dermatitidis ATCC 18188]|uniref:Uncharacterized protein n=1 Tax=Ajellomyces dermatitidis (strain ATCC 18188 / CBS 674.68) TaxID=653446 RepID=F2T8L1_AJEDA|nr:hypothetical protein BDDG_02515 [Blastomyces dermatitidis ATCC 18188]
MSADDNEFNVESLIENLKNAIMKELLMPCVAESSASLSPLSVPFSAAPPQSSTPVPVSGSPASAIPVPVTLTSATSGFAVSAFVISSPRFKKMFVEIKKLLWVLLFASVSEIILIKDNNTTETTLFCPQASLITFSSSSAGNVVCTPDHKHSALSDSHCHSFSSAPSPPSVSSASALPAPAPGSAGPTLSFNFSTRTHAHFYIDISVNLAINDINVIHRAVEESEACITLLQEQLATLKSLADLKF